MIFIGTYSGAASACSCADMTIEELWEWSDSGALIKPNVFLVEFTRIESTHLGRKGGAYKTAYFKVLETYRGTAEHTPYVSTIFDTMLTNCSRSLPDNLIGEQWIGNPPANQQESKVEFSRKLSREILHEKIEIQ